MMDTRMNTAVKNYNRQISEWVSEWFGQYILITLTLTHTLSWVCQIFTYSHFSYYSTLLYPGICHYSHTHHTYRPCTLQHRLLVEGQSFLFRILSVLHGCDFLNKIWFYSECWLINEQNSPRQKSTEQRINAIQKEEEAAAAAVTEVRKEKESTN